MDIKNLTDTIRHLEVGRAYRVEQKVPANKLMNTYFDLNLNLGLLFEKALTGEKITGNSDELLDLYCDALVSFLQIANNKKWTYLLLVSDEELGSLKEKWQTASFAKIYLILQKLLNQSYFEHQDKSFQHAWHIFLKFGIVELKFTITQIESHFFARYGEDAL